MYHEAKRLLFHTQLFNFHAQVLLLLPFVLDKPNFNFGFNNIDDTLIVETVSLVPANYTWMLCSSSNDRYDYSQKKKTFFVNSNVKINVASKSKLSLGRG